MATHSIVLLDLEAHRSKKTDDVRSRCFCCFNPQHRTAVKALGLPENALEEGKMEG